MTALLADLHREQGVERIKLTGLDGEDVLALMEAAAGHELDEDGRALAREITRETAGNPFFAGEVLRHLTESGAIVQEDGGRWRLVGELAELGLPQSVREVVGRRVERLGPDARTALSAAAVIGRDFDLDLLLAVSSSPRLGCSTCWRRRSRRRCCRRAQSGRGASRSPTGSSSTRCMRISGRPVARGFTGRWPKRWRSSAERSPASDWASSPATGPRRSSAPTPPRRSTTPGEPPSARSSSSPRDEAERWYRQALELHDQAPGGDRSERCDLLIGLGEAQRQVGNPEFRQTLLDAAGLAQELGDVGPARPRRAGQHARIDQPFGRGGQRAGASARSRRASPPDGDPRRAQVLALLASELHYAGEPSRCRQLAAEAIEIARAAGDEAALAHTLSYASWAITAPDTLAQRRLLVGELFDLTQRLDDPRLSPSRLPGALPLAWSPGIARRSSPAC